VSLILGNRGRRILRALVDEYIATGEPVGSRTLSKREDLDLSPATIRNALADLEDLGLIAQPHTSAGRIPTEIGFRYFVEALVEPTEPSAEQRRFVKKRLRAAIDNDVVAESGRVLSELTNAAVVVRSTRADDEPLAQLHFMQLGERRLLAVAISRSGHVQNRVVPMHESMKEGDLERLNNFIGELARGRTLVGLRDAVAREVEEGRLAMGDLVMNAMAVLQATSEQAESAGVVIEGQPALFDRKEFADVTKLRGFVRAFEDKQRWLDLLDRTLAAGGVHVVIGAEANLPVEDISLVSARVGRPNEPLGVLSVVGPQRLDYAQIVPLVRFTAEAVTELLDAPVPADEGSLH
jgi:heat-inducible transcriptional repressor